MDAMTIHGAGAPDDGDADLGEGLRDLAARDPGFARYLEQEAARASARRTESLRRRAELAAQAAADPAPAAERRSFADFAATLVTAVWTAPAHFGGKANATTLAAMLAEMAERVADQDFAPGYATSEPGYALTGKGLREALDAAVAEGLVHHVEGDEDTAAGWHVFSDLVVVVEVEDGGGIATVWPYVATTAGCWDAELRDMIDMTDDPYFDSGNEEDQDFHVAGDDLDGLERVLKDVAATSDAMEEGVCGIRISSETGEEAAQVAYVQDWDDYELHGNAASPRDAALFELVLAAFQPSGWEWQYNDGARDRASGYYASSRNHDVELDVDPPSATLRAVARNAKARTRIQARRRLIAWMGGAGASSAAVAAEEATLAAEEAALPARKAPAASAPAEAAAGA